MKKYIEGNINGFKFRSTEPMAIALKCSDLIDRPGLAERVVNWCWEQLTSKNDNNAIEYNEDGVFLKVVVENINKSKSKDKMDIDEAIQHAKEVAKENRQEAIECEECSNRKLDKVLMLDKVHKEDKASCEKCAEEHEQLAVWLEELKEYRQNSICLPCQVGDFVYTNRSMSGWYMRKENRPYVAKVVFIGINNEDNFMNVDFGSGRMMQFNFSQIGKDVFLTKHEANEALKGIL